MVAPISVNGLPTGPVLSVVVFRLGCMFSTFATADPVVNFLSLQLVSQSRALSRLIDQYRRQPSAVAPKAIHDEIVKARQTFAIAKAAVEQSRHSVAADSCFGIAVMDYLRANSEAAAALPNPAKAA